MLLIESESFISMDSVLNDLRVQYAQASVYNYNTPGREGCVVWLNETNASDVIFTGDLHGHRGNFYDLCELADLENNPRRHLVFQELCHGGSVYSDGSCASHLLVEDVAKMVCQYPGRVHLVLGNHEMAEMTNFPIRKRGKLLNILFSLGLQHRYGTANAWQVHDWMTNWFWSCPVAIRWKKDVFFAHSIPSDCLSFPFDCSFFDRPIEEKDFSYNGSFSRLVWGRDYFEDNARAFAEEIGAKFLITGHEPCIDMGFKQPNPIQIILDCCDDTPAYIYLTADMPTDPMTMRTAVHFL